MNNDNFNRNSNKFDRFSNDPFWGPRKTQNYTDAVSVDVDNAMPAGLPQDVKMVGMKRYDNRRFGKQIDYIGQ